MTAVAQQRSGNRGPRGRTGPGRGSGRTGRSLSGDTGSQPRTGAGRTDRPGRTVPRPRVTGRMGVFVLVMLVLVVSYASSFKAYLQQRHDIDALSSQIVEREKAIAELQDQKTRWDDPAYLEQQAREKFGYVMPGQTAYVALDANGEPIKPSGRLSSPDSVGKPQEPTAWWSEVWSSDLIAGHPPAVGTPPATKIGQ